MIFQLPYPCYKATYILRKYYNELLLEYYRLPNNIIKGIFNKYFTLSDEMYIRQKEDYLVIVSKECYPKGWLDDIKLVVYVYPGMIEMYFNTVAYLPDFVDTLIDDKKFRELALLVLHITRI